MPTPAIASTPMRVLLVNLNNYDQPYAVYPLGLAYIDAALRNAGYATRIWDTRLSAQSLDDAIADFTPAVIGLSLRNVDNVQAHNPKSFIHELLAVCRRVRTVTTAKLVLGGSGFSVFPAQIFELTGVDYGIAGEAEERFVRLLDAIRDSSDPAAVRGVWHRDAAGTPELLTSLERNDVFTTEPCHDPELLNAYVAQGSLPGVQTQRGCPLHCTYCTYPLIEGKRSRFREPAEIVAEVRRLSALGVRYVFIVDSVFNTRADHVAKICEALIDAKLDVQWECFLRPRGITRELLQLMQRAGLHHIEFGSDSFSDPVLNQYGKSFRFAEIQSTSEIAHSLGIRYSHFIIFGGPGETPETVEETLERTQLLPGSYYFATIGMRVYPETPLWRTLQARQPVPLQASDYLLEPRFHVEPPLTIAGLYARLRQVQATSSNWAVGDPPPAFTETMAKLRQRGIRGPLWEYAELLQRLQANSPTSTAVGSASL